VLTSNDAMSDHARASRTSPPPLRASELQVDRLPSWKRLPAIGIGLAAVGLGLTLALGLGRPEQLWRSWLLGAFYALTLGLGALFFVLIHHATQAGWSVAVRRTAENAMATLPWMALLFAPLLFNLAHLFPWTDANAMAHDAVLAHKRPLFNTPFFVLRNVLYFTFWTLSAFWFARQSRLQDASGDPKLTRRMRTATAPALLLFALTVTFAGIDWLMGLDADWYSTMFGVYVFAGCLVAIYAFMSLVTLAQRREEPFASALTGEHVYTLGMLLFAFVSFWGYIAFSQYLLIWYANIPDETGYMAARLAGSWRVVSALLVVGHFVAPFFFLMARGVKKNAKALAAAAIWMLLMHALDLYWLIMPGLHPDSAAPSLTDFAALLGAFGLFLAAFGWASRRQALVPLRDPRLPESLVFENV